MNVPGDGTVANSVWVIRTWSHATDELLFACTLQSNGFSANAEVDTAVKIIAMTFFIQFAPIFENQISSFSTKINLLPLIDPVWHVMELTHSIKSTNLLV